jgi:4-amino-4-deoxy-L-arabinose transferase-like glycosyltransferase
VDEVVFVAAFGAVATLRAHRARDLKAAVAPLAACVIAAVVLSPWIAWNISLDGSPMPSSGKAEGAHVDVAHNLDSALRAAGAWSLPPVLRPSMHFTPVPVSEVLAALAIALVIAAVAFTRRRARPPLGEGTTALIALAGFLAAWYVFKFGPWWFMERYLAPLLLLTIPWLATALELRRPRPRALGALAALVLVANVPVFAVLAGGSDEPPAWSARDSNLGAHANLNHTEQLAWIRRHVAPQCTVGGFEAGTLVYFRDNVVNLDGKVDHDALQARMDGRTPEYVDERGIDLIVDIESGPIRALRGHREQWRLVEDMGRYEAWVRTRRETACLTG